MKEKINEVLLKFPSEDHVDKVCQPGKEEKTCRYLLVGSRGWECGKTEPDRD